MGNSTERTLTLRLNLTREIFKTLADESKAHSISAFCAWMSISDLKVFLEHLKNGNPQ